MLPSRAKQSLARNLRKISGGTDTQGFRERLSKKTGGAVSPRTIGTMMSEDSGNPTLANIEAVASALGLTISELLADDSVAKETRGSYSASLSADSSPEAARLIERYLSADPATRALIDIALGQTNREIPHGLSDSLATLVASARDYIAKQLKAQ